MEWKIAEGILIAVAVYGFVNMFVELAFAGLGKWAASEPKPKRPVSSTFPSERPATALDVAITICAALIVLFWRFHAWK